MKTQARMPNFQQFFCHVSFLFPGFSAPSLSPAQVLGRHKQRAGLDPRDPPRHATAGYIGSTPDSAARFRRQTLTGEVQKRARNGASYRCRPARLSVANKELSFWPPENSQEPSRSPRRRIEAGRRAARHYPLTLPSGRAHADLSRVCVLSHNRLDEGHLQPSTQPGHRLHAKTLVFPDTTLAHL